MPDSLLLHGWCSPWNSPGQNTGVGTLSPLQGIFLTQGSNRGLPHCWHILYQLSHKGSPRILEWVAYAFSSRSSWLRNWTRVSCIIGRFFINWAINEVATWEILFQGGQWLNPYAMNTYVFNRGFHFSPLWYFCLLYQIHTKHILLHSDITSTGGFDLSLTLVQSP